MSMLSPQQLQLHHFNCVSFLTNVEWTCRGAYLRSDGVFDANDSNAGEVIQYVVLCIPVRLSCLGWEVPVRDADRPQSIAGHRLNHFTYHLVAIFQLKCTRLTLIVQDARTSGRGDGKRNILTSAHPSVTPVNCLYRISYFLRMISEAPLLYMRKPPSAFFSTVLIDFREELKV